MLCMLTCGVGFSCRCLVCWCLFRLVCVCIAFVLSVFGFGGLCSVVSVLVGCFGLLGSRLCAVGGGLSWVGFGAFAVALVGFTFAWYG